MNGLHFGKVGGRFEEILQGSKTLQTECMYIGKVAGWVEEIVHRARKPVRLNACL